MTDYNYDAFSPDNYNLQSADGPEIGQKALELVLSGKPAKMKSYFNPAKPWVVISTARRAGKGSGKDFALGLPRLIWNVLIKNNVRTFLR